MHSPINDALDRLSIAIGNIALLAAFPAAFITIATHLH